MRTFEDGWRPIRTFGAMGIYGDPWEATGTYGHLREPIGVFGVLWDPMGS